MLSGATRISQQTLSAAPARHAQPSSKRIDRSTTKLLPGGSCTTNRAREHILTQASFLDTLVAGGSPAKTGNRQQAEELVDQLLKLTGRGSTPKKGPDEDIDQIIKELTRLNPTKNAAKSALLSDGWNVRYTSLPPRMSPFLKPRLTLTDAQEFEALHGGTQFGFLPTNLILGGKMKIVGSNTFETKAEYVTLDKGLFGKETREESYENVCEILYLDERMLLLSRGRSENGKRVEDPIVQIYERNGAIATKEAAVGPSVKSDISVGGIADVASKSGVAKETERSNKKQQNRMAEDGTSIAATNRESKKEAQRLRREKEAADKEAAKALAEREATKQKAAAEKEAAKLKAATEREAARQKAETEREAAKQKAVAERAAADALKAEIKASVDNFNQRVKDAQEGKKLAATDLRDFEKENSGILKEIKAFRKEQESLEEQIASLQDDIVALGEDEKARALEIKDCKREITDLERKLATF